MKPIYLKPGQNVVFLKMKKEPDGHHWEKLPSYERHLAIMATSEGPYLRVCHTIAENPEADGIQWIKIPYLPGEICYVREMWLISDLFDRPISKDYDGELWVYKGKVTEALKDRLVYYTDHVGKWEGAWRSPVTMPQWAARRHVRIVSCEPMNIKNISLADIEALGFHDDRATFNATRQFETFMQDWIYKHPGKEWAWRVKVEDSPS